ncbi:phage tail tape measure protein [Limimaricola hongkongensis]|uniref:GTA tail tape measure n=1 Tax=Limimaricola hongkongensis DSM 17492 TaxID=1122180 RepID=A0A017HI04_9RHOB|nr:GTA tail tape measure [Limimaricola hongkongensis DSM 17492]
MTEDEFEALERAMEETGNVAESFSRELARMRDGIHETTRDLGRLERGFAGGIRRAIDGVLFEGRSPGGALKGLAGTMSDTVYGTAMRPVTGRLGGALARGVNGLVAGLMPFADGGAFSGGRVTPFARGGVVSGPVAFPMRGGTGLMGEAGPEAILPLSRGPDGRLGVAAGAQGGAVRVTVNIATPDAQSFQRSRGQVAAQIARAVDRGRRDR